MKLKYRVKEWQHPIADDYYTAQYKIFGLWLNINIMQVGRLSKPSSTICETADEAMNRIKIHKANMARAKDVFDRCGVTVWEG